MNNRKPIAVSKRSGETIKPSLSVGTDAGINSVHRPKTGVSNANVKKKRNMVAVREVPIRTERKKERAPYRRNIYCYNLYRAFFFYDNKLR